MAKHGRRTTEGTTHLYHSLQWQVLEERDGGGVARTQFVYSPVYVDGLVGRYRDADNNGTLEEYRQILQDANWNVTGLANSTDTILRRFVYDAYGRRSVLTSTWLPTTDALGLLNGHQGLRHDPAVTEVIDNRHRLYHTTLSRFMQMDPHPAGPYVDGMSGYEYVTSRPSVYRDPLGLALYALDGTLQHEQQQEITNVKKFSDMYAGEKQYFRGVGNELDNNAVGEVVGGGLAVGAHGIVGDVYNTIAKTYSDGMKTGNTDKTTIDIVGYSRGGAMAIHLANKIQSEGLPNVNGKTKTIRERYTLPSGPKGPNITITKYRNKTVYCEYFHPKIRFLGLFDPVASFGLGALNMHGLPLQFPDLGWNLGRPTNTDHISNIVRAPDGRLFFRTVDIKNPTTRIQVDMNHGEVGASQQTLQMMVNSAISAGVQFKPDKAQNYGIQL